LADCRGKVEDGYFDCLANLYAEPYTPFAMNSSGPVTSCTGNPGTHIVAYTDRTSGSASNPLFMTRWFPWNLGGSRQQYNERYDELVHRWLAINPPKISCV